MSQLATLTELYANLEQDVPGVQDQTMLQALRAAAREFCRRTEAFREHSNKIAGVEYQQDYAIAVPYSLTAQVKRILNVTVNSVRQPVNAYELHLGKYLRFNDNYIPHDMEDRLLKCGTNGSSTIGDWNALTAASWGASIDGSTYSITGQNFSTDSDMYEVAARLQTGLRAAQECNTGFVEWAEDHFNMWVESGEIGYVTADTTGTDISGAGFIDGLTGGDATLSGNIGVSCAWTPDFNTGSIPTWFLDLYSQALIGRAVHTLASQNKKPWTSRTAAQKGYIDWNHGLNAARREEVAGQKDGIVSVGA